jgi:deoxyribodipyrimidine photolyase-related protein
MNLKLISPKEIIESSELYWKKHQDKIDIAQIEGFIRQILGWREFMRGIYWKHMPGYENSTTSIIADPSCVLLERKHKDAMC